MLKEIIELLEQDCSAGSGKNRPSGEWRVQGGELVCDGYDLEGRFCYFGKGVT